MTYLVALSVALLASAYKCVPVRYIVLQCVAVCCIVLHCVAVCCSVLLCAAVCCSVLQCVAVCCSVRQCVAMRCSVLQCVARCAQCGAGCCSVCLYFNDHFNISVCIALSKSLCVYKDLLKNVPGSYLCNLCVHI